MATIDLTQPTEAFIGGEWRENTGGDPIEVVNPTTGKPLARMGVSSTAEIDGAVAAARAAVEGGPWGRMTGFDRRRAMLRLADELRASADHIGEMNTDDVGMPLLFTVGQVDYVADYVEYYAGWADKLVGEAPPSPRRRILDYTIRHPVGVVAAVVPWNIPVTVTAFKLAPALAAGCTVVIKPSELAPLAVLELVAAVERAGLPPGVINLVSGAGDVGAQLVGHPGVDMITFTGGTATGAEIGAVAARQFKRVTLELGGKSANIVFADADLDRAADGICQGFLINTGQQCTAGSRVLVQRPVYDEVIERTVAATANYPIGDPRAPTTLVGPLISEAHRQRVLGFVEDAGDAGRVVLGGEALGGDLADGFFVSPTIVADADLSSRLCTEEIFGPVIAVHPFDEPDEAIRIANDSPYGLVAGVWTENVNTAHWAAQRLQAGSIWVNTYLGVEATSPFGGHKASGIGREGGWEAVVGFTETTNVMTEIQPPR